ncbi:phage scaffolding protein [Anaerotignum sp.]|nr:phage scaffolding protein [Anaerotignum sp.]MBP3306497.1 phage scaffolding protein [Anaerotignum sp.]
MTDKELREMGVADAIVRKDILNALEKEAATGSDLQTELNEALAELEAVKKQAAVEKAILEAGGKHVKAILALIDMEQVAYDEKKGLQGLDLDEIREEAPYLFHEKEEKKKGTGMTKGSQKKREDEIRAAFWGLK